MKGLSIHNFWKLRPKLPFRFTTKFFTGLKKNGVFDNILSYTVTTVNLPKIEGQTSEGSVYLGNSIFTIPVWNVSTRKIEIGFEETDNMDVSNFLAVLMDKSYGKVPWRITIAISEYEEHMLNEKSNVTAYICHLASYDEPQFRREGQAGQVTINSSFIIDAVIKNWNGVDIVTGDARILYNPEFNPELNKVSHNIENDEFKFGDANIGLKSYFANGGVEPKHKKLSEFMSTNVNRDANYDALLNKMKAAGVNTRDTGEVIEFLRDEGYILNSYQAGLTGLCATSTYLVAAITSGQDKLGATAGNGKDQKLDRYGYTKINSGKGVNTLMSLDPKSLQEGDVINISYKKGTKNSEFGHAVTVVRNKKTGELEFYSDYKQGSIHGLADPNKIDSWYIQRKS